MDIPRAMDSTHGAGAWQPSDRGAFMNDKLFLGFEGDLHRCPHPVDLDRGWTIRSPRLDDP
jgi:hypothetical protein